MPPKSKIPPYSKVKTRSEAQEEQEAAKEASRKQPPPESEEESDEDQGGGKAARPAEQSEEAGYESAHSRGPPEDGDSQEHETRESDNHDGAGDEEDRVEDEGDRGAEDQEKDEQDQDKSSKKHRDKSRKKSKSKSKGGGDGDDDSSSSGSDSSSSDDDSSSSDEEDSDDSDSDSEVDKSSKRKKSKRSKSSSKQSKQKKKSKKKSRKKKQKKKEFSLTPYQKPDKKAFKWHKKTDKAIYTKATSPLFHALETKFGLKSSEVPDMVDRCVDRCTECNITMWVIVHRSYGTHNTQEQVNVFTQHGQYSLEDATDHVMTYAGKPTREAQIDVMWYTAIMSSLTPEAVIQANADRNKFVISRKGKPDHCSGTILFKLVLNRAKVNTTMDPEVVKTMISRAASKFASMNYNLDAFKTWFSEMMKHLHSSGTTSSDALSHVMMALKSTPEKEVSDYISQWEDRKKDSMEDYTPEEAIDKAIIKSQRLETYRNQANLLNIDATNDELNALKSEILDGVKQNINALATEMAKKRGYGPRGSSNNRGGRGRGRGGRGRGNGGGRGRGRGGRSGDRRPREKIQYLPPPELKNVGKPSDPNTKKIVNGVEHLWCDNHSWCSHKTCDCRKPKTGILHPENPNNKNGNGGSQPGGGNRNGRAVTAYSALLTRVGKQHQD